ncbi:zinc finger and BTB domain-containing protein 17 isoform X3 [Achroia grisella]|uniref:zinc finger and BTB domain-containing protein 17 isoform X3 n=1 Tax=Achroia grisella TaxID=688607 RepID=UPI0027D2FA2F|nr:zinc finger and BTB domain-containing protein 17 isoform X3 [Achroia grisella]
MAPRPSCAQIEALVQFLERNPGIARGWLRTNSAKAETKRKWAILAPTLNSLGGTIKNGVGWAKYWAEKKCGLKKQCTERRSEGGTFESLNLLTDLDRRMFNIMGGQQYLAGDLEVSVDPFPSSNVSVTMPDEGDIGNCPLPVGSLAPPSDLDINDVNERDDTITMTSTDTYQLKWHSHSSHLNGSVAALLRSERFTDVVLCTMDGSQIPAHKFILSSCSVYLSNLFEGQRSVTRMGGMLYVVLPSEISTKALKILVEYMYKGETTVSNEVLDTVLKAGEVLKIRGLWRQTDEAGGDSTPAEKTTAPMATASVNKQIVAKKPEDMQPKITVKKDDKLLKTFGQVQPQGVTRPMFIGPPKLVFIKTTEGGTQAALRPGAPKGQTILVAPAQTADSTAIATTVAAPAPVQSVAVATIADDSPDEAPPPRILRRHAAERKYGKKQRVEASTETEEAKDDDNQDNVSVTSKKSTQSNLESTEVHVKDEPEWDASSIEEEERSIAEMFQAEMSVKSEPIDDMEIEEESLMYSPLACELCAEVFTVPAAWVRHVQGHAHQDQPPARKRKHRSASDDTEETMALLRCDLCQKHFPNPAEWVRHIQSTHTETEGAQNKNCTHCKKAFPSHASMLIHLRTHTGERPFICGLCNKGFNVKSNLLRHLRTLHDQLISPAQVEGDDSEESTSAPGPSEVKRES